MSLRTRILVLRRIRAGDQDLLAKAYGQGGIISLYIKDGFLSTNRFFGFFEPFNILEVDVSQRGGVMVPNDVISIQRLSYLCRDFSRFAWMSWIASFILKHVSYYDERLFDLFTNYLLLELKGSEHLYKVKLKLDFLHISGLKPKFLEERIRRKKLRIKLSDGTVAEEGELEVEGSVLRLLSRLYRIRKLGNLVVDHRLIRKMEELLDTFIEYHTR